MVAFKKSKSVFETSFAPKCIDAHPEGEITQAAGMFCFPDGISLRKQISPPESFSFIITQEDGSRVYCTCLCFQEPLSSEMKKRLGIPVIGAGTGGYGKNEVFVSKAIVLMSHFPFSKNYKGLLSQIYRLSLSKSEVPLERIVSNVINDLRFPPLSETNFSTVNFGIGNESLFFRNTISFPFLSSDCLQNLFLLLRSDQIVDLVEALMLERKILLISKHKSLLTQVSEALVCLLYPFVWTHVLIPVEI